MRESKTVKNETCSTPTALKKKETQKKDILNFRNVTRKTYHPSFIPAFKKPGFFKAYLYMLVWIKRSNLF